MRYVSTYRAKFHGWKEGNHGVVQAQDLKLEIETGLTEASLIHGQGVQGNITRSARDTAEDHEVVGITLNQGRPGVGSNKRLQISKQQATI